MNKIIITGGLGFIFSHVTEYFLEKGYNVLVIDDLSTGSHPELAEKWIREYPKTFNLSVVGVEKDIVGDIIVPFNPHYIVHAAAISDVDFSINNPVDTISRNNNGTVNVFQAARKCTNLEKLLYVSTDEVYGECDHPKTEEEIIFPKNPYALSKAFGSLLRLAYDNTYPELKDKTCETRFCNVFGPRQDDRKIFPAIKRAINGGLPLTLHNRGEGFRQFIHVAEIPQVIDLLLEKGHRTYNITAGEGFTVKELCEITEQVTGKAVPTLPGNRSGMDMRYDMSSQRMFDEFGWKPKIPFAERVKQYLKTK